MLSTIGQSPINTDVSTTHSSGTRKSHQLPNSLSSEASRPCTSFFEHLQKVAIEYMFARIMRALSLAQSQDYIEARNDLHIFHGLFGFSLKDFLDRRKKDTIYLDLLRLVQAQKLDRAKTCIVVDELRSYISRLLFEHEQGNMEPILSDIDGAVRLLTLDDSIRAEYTMNNELLSKLNNEKQQFDHYMSSTTQSWNQRIWEQQNIIADEAIVIRPMEFRVRLKHYDLTLEGLKESWTANEKKLESELDHIKSNWQREHLASKCVKMKHQSDIARFKTRIKIMSKRYDHEEEYWNGSVGYYKNSLVTMRKRKADCKELMIIYKEKIEELKEWHCKRKMQKAARSSKAGKTMGMTKALRSIDAK